MKSNKTQSPAPSADIGALFPGNPVIPELQQELKDTIRDEKYKLLIDLIGKRDGAFKLPATLKSLFLPSKLAQNGKESRAWEIIGLIYRNGPRYYEAINIFNAMYEQLIEFQQSSNTWTHKGLPLIFISDCYNEMGCPVLGKRYLMLALCEDAIRGKGFISPEKTGVYFRAVRWYGLSDTEVSNYAKRVYEHWSENERDAIYPELILLEFEKDWIQNIHPV